MFVENEETVTDMDGFDSMLDGLAPLSPAAAQEAAAAATEPAAETETDPTATTGEEPGAEPAAEQDSEVDQLPQSKQNQAFAQLRVHNKRVETVLQRLCQHYGLEADLAKDPDKLLAHLDEEDVTAQAEEMHVPKEILQRMNTLERQNALAQAERLQQTATLGFAKVQQEFGLDDKELRNFAMQLANEGINPFEQEIDLPKEYKLRNFDAITEKKVQAAVEAALAKVNKASQHSTAPAKTKGKPDAPAGDKVNTMAQFDSMLLSIGK